MERILLRAGFINARKRFEEAGMHLLRDPVYGEDYGRGWVFFSYCITSPISAGIALFSRDEALSRIPLSHCGIVTGERCCIEATDPGVIFSDFKAKYLDDPTIVVFLRRPQNLDEDISTAMIEHARDQLGKGYAYKGVFGSALYNILGLHKIGWFRKGKNPFNAKDEYFCSELVAESMIIGYPNRPGTLIYHPSNIYPVTLFEDKEIFDPWRVDVVEKKTKEGRIVESVGEVPNAA